jgi:mannose-1-phosphate guanylyltransferase/mannose-6-phosphate isomerase
MHDNNPITIVPVILCGGSGTRLWPLSRAGFPKQFLVISGTMSLFQQAIERVNGLAAEDIVVGETLIVTGEEHRFLALDQLREMPEIEATLLLEPVGRNTAPALTFAALQAVDQGEDPIMVVTPADQTVKNSDAFTDALQRSVRAATSGSIVILGIAPDKPETGYGYIKQQANVGAYGEHGVAQFAEKPDLATAMGYIESGGYCWNGGMFVVRASVWLAALGQFRSDILQATAESCAVLSSDLPFVRPDKALFSSIPSESIDYAVMEHCPGSNVDIKMIPLDAGWNDLGSWDAVWQVGESDDAGNVTSGDIILADTKNTFVLSSSRLVTTVGVDNLVIVETADAILIAEKSQSQHVKKIVSELVTLKRSEHILPRKVHRPWGWYDSIDEGARFKVKRIQVNPGASLSLQSHQKRAEHWVVVKGTAEVICGDKTMTLTENQSTYIPLGEVHRLSNPGTTSLEIIEVQSGSYLGEDDIVRFEDTYGR